MYPLASQIYFVCFQAQEAVYRLRGEPVPEALAQVRQQGWSANEHVGTMADARARIAEALSFLGGLAPDTLDKGRTQQIALDLPNGMIFDMTGEQYARDWVLPQFYFHLTTAYALMRGQVSRWARATSSRIPWAISVRAPCREAEGTFSHKNEKGRSRKRLHPFFHSGGRPVPGAQFMRMSRISGSNQSNFSVLLLIITALVVK